MIPRDLTRLPASEMFLNLRYGQTVFTVLPVFGASYSVSR